MGIQIQRSLPYLKAGGLEVTIVTRELPDGNRKDDCDQGVIVDRILPQGTGLVSIARRVFEFRRYFEKRHAAFDVLYTSLLGWELLLNAPRLKNLGLPVVVEMVLLDGDDPLALSRERMGSLKLRLLRRVDLWAGISNAFLSRVQEAGIPAEKFRSVYPGVDIEKYRPVSPAERRAIRHTLDLPLDARIVISVGSVIHRKGFDRLLNAWARFRPVRGRDLLLLVGPASLEEGLCPGDLTFLQEIQDASRSSDLDGTVRLIGRAMNVHEYFAAADLFVLLSRQEGLPIVSVESLATGLPVLMSPLDGVGDVVVEGETGRVVPDPDDSEAVSVSLTALLDRPQERAAMGVAARRVAVTRFSFEARAQAMASLCRALASGRAPVT